jgi:ribosomal protein S27AE
MFIPYVYKIGWSKHNKFYIGSQYGYKLKIARPDNLWTSYFTSSKRVSEFRRRFGEPDIIEILYKNENFELSNEDRAKDVLSVERSLLQLNSVKLSEKFLNKSDTFCFRANDDISNEKRSSTQKKRYEKDPEYRQKISKGVKVSREKDPTIVQRIKATRESNGGYVYSEEAKEKMSNSAKIRANTDEGKERMKAAALSLKETLSKDPDRKKEIYEKVAAGTRGIKREKVQCPNCGQSGALNVMVRWHFDNCRVNSQPS